MQSVRTFLLLVACLMPNLVACLADDVSKRSAVNAVSGIAPAECRPAPLLN